MLRIGINILLSFLVAELLAQEFTGQLHYVQTTTYDTSQLIFYVDSLNPSVRIKTNDTDFLYAYSDQKQRFIVYNNLTDDVSNVKRKPFANDSSWKAPINITGNYTYMLGIVSYQWRVKLPEQKLELSYWMSPGSYNLFNNLLIKFNFQNPLFLNYLNLPDCKHNLPIRMTERNLVRDIKMDYQLISIKRY